MYETICGIRCLRRNAHHNSGGVLRIPCQPNRARGTSFSSQGISRCIQIELVARKTFNQSSYYIASAYCLSARVLTRSCLADFDLSIVSRQAHESSAPEGSLNDHRLRLGHKRLEFKLTRIDTSTADLLEQLPKS